MSDVIEAGRCLNCNAPLHGPFCGACGQRAVPPDPTVRELAGDAWHELTGYDGRIMATLRGLGRPGFLTREYIAGRRAQYLPPVRIYFIVSVLYFLIAAAAPEIGDGGVRIDVTDSDRGSLNLTEEDRKQLLAEVETAAWYVRPMLRSILVDPAGFRARMFTILPRVAFALLPVFAAIVFVFYRRQHFPTALVFAVHLHVFAFIVFGVSEAAKFSYSETIAGIVGVIMLAIFVIYALRSFRSVFGGSWPMTLIKAVSIASLYLVASIPAFIVMFVWASFW
jgi:hypothetical protein